MKRPKRIPKIPKRFYFSECYYAKIVLIDPTEIQGQRGEWAVNLDEDDACIGAIRISKAEPQESQWDIYIHELLHAIHDYYYVKVTEHWTTTYEAKERMNGEPTVL